MKDLKEYLDTYRADIEVVAQNYGHSNHLSGSLMNNISNDITTLVNKYLEIGAIAETKAEDKDPNILFLSYRVRSEISYELKDYLILMRNIYVEALKADAFRSDNRLSIDAYENFLKESNSILHEAGISLSQYITNILSQIGNEKFVNQDLKYYKLVESPWKVYHAQFDELINQISKLKNQADNYSDVSNAFANINGQVNNLLDSIDEEVELIDVATQAMSDEYNTEQLNFTSANERIERLETASIYKDSLKNKLESIDVTIKNLNKYEFAIGHNEGNLVNRSVDLSLLTPKWLELSMVPTLAEIQDRLKMLKTKSDLSAKNMRNKISLLNEKNHDEYKSDLSINADKLKNEQAKFIEEITNKKNQVKELLKNEFRAVQIYSDKPFLSTDLQSSVNQIMRDQNKLVEVINERFGQRQEELKYFFSKFQKQEQLTRAEKIAITLSSRGGKHATESYDQVFLRQNIFSEFYIIEREDINERANESIKLWREGFSGSMIVTGAPLSGKTTFANHFMRHNFSSDYLSLVPNSENTFNGRKVTINENLGDALNEVLKSRINKPTCLLIDDFELWHDDKTNLLQDARDLVEFINRCSQKIYVVLGIGPVALNLLDVYMDFSGHFLSVVDVSKTDLNYFNKIINLRHTATHKTLVKSDGTEYTSSDFLSLIKQVYKNSMGSIGEGLMRWASASKEINSDQVVFEYTDTKIDNFITRENEVLLEQFFKYKNLTDKELISIFTGEQYEDVRYQLRSLLRNKILVRDDNGYIHINDLIISETYRFYMDRFSQKINIAK